MQGLKYVTGVVSLQYDLDRCIGCGMCVTVCPHMVFSLEEGRAVLVNCDACMECGACMQNCQAGAIWVKAGEGCVRAIINQLLGIDGPCC